MSSSLIIPEITTQEGYETLFFAALKKYFTSGNTVEVPESGRDVCFRICQDLLGLEESACEALINSVPEITFGSTEYRTLWHQHAGEADQKKRVGGFLREQINCVIRKYNSLIAK